VSLEVSSVGFRDLVDNMDRTFRQIAEERKLEFHVEVDPKLPVAIRTDSKRLQQVLRNLLSNAFKFTERGGVTLQIGSAEGSPLRAGSKWIAMSVTDTGIGIPEDKLRIIFEAFQQADGTTSRKYGGTGLGLSISREIARLLGGEIVVSSTPGSGSTFTLFVPVEPPASHGLPGAGAAARPNGDAVGYYAGTEDSSGSMIRQPSAAMALSASLDDRHAITNGDRIVLIVEDDAMFASVLLELAREEGFKGLIAMDGASAPVGPSIPRLDRSRSARLESLHHAGARHAALVGNGAARLRLRRGLAALHRAGSQGALREPRRDLVRRPRARRLLRIPSAGHDLIPFTARWP